MIVTVISDASVHEGIGAWAAWAKSERGQVGVKAAVFREPCANSTVAELMAFVNGLHCALAAGVAVDGDTILAQIDNKGTLSLVGGRRPGLMHGRKSILKAMDALQGLLAEHNLVVKTKHIKAHSGTGTPRTYVHDLCDKAARRVCRTAARAAQQVPS